MSGTPGNAIRLDPLTQNIQASRPGDQSPQYRRASNQTEENLTLINAYKDQIKGAITENSGKTRIVFPNEETVTVEKLEGGSVIKLSYSSPYEEASYTTINTDQTLTKIKYRGNTTKEWEKTFPKNEGVLEGKEGKMTFYKDDGVTKQCEQTGPYKGDKFEGEGGKITYYKDDGTTKTQEQTGPFKNNKLDGIGTLTNFINNQTDWVLTGVYKNGELTGEGTIALYKNGEISQTLTIPLGPLSPMP